MLESIYIDLTRPLNLERQIVQPTAQQVEQRISPWAQHYGVAVRTIEERPGEQTTEILYFVKDIFTTINGSLEPDGSDGSIPRWAGDAYLKPEFMEAGGDHYLFAAVIGLDGQLVAEQEVTFWSDGFDKLFDPAYEGYIHEQTKSASRWANLPMGGGSAYQLDQGERGPWCWGPTGRSEIVCGSGLPNGRPISTFVVWQAVEVTLSPPSPPIATGTATLLPTHTPTPNPTTTPTPDDPEATLIASPVPIPATPTPTRPPAVSNPPNPSLQVVRRQGEWIQPLGVQIHPLSERPDHPGGDIVYLVKDLFTTRDGQWEPAGSEVVGSVSGWARQDYLKPLGAPDYFDDAGADHHLFAAMIGLDGKFVPESEIRFWSDGFAKLGDATYNDYVLRLTKPHSGWANIPLDGGSSFVPERGEQGPWCWSPSAAAEVVCGGGMPAKQHISFFVVWQAVKLATTGDSQQPSDTPVIDPSSTNHVFLPFALLE